MKPKDTATTPRNQKHVRVPEDVDFVAGWDNDGKEIKTPFTFFRHFLVRTILSDKVFGVNYETILQAAAIRGAFEDKRPGSVVALSPDHYEKLRTVVKTPSDGYQSFVIVQCVPYIEAILNPVPEEG